MGTNCVFTHPRFPLRMPTSTNESEFARMFVEERIEDEARMVQVLRQRLPELMKRREELETCDELAGEWVDLQSRQLEVAKQNDRLELGWTNLNAAEGLKDDCQRELEQMLGYHNKPWKSRKYAKGHGARHSYFLFLGLCNWPVPLIVPIFLIVPNFDAKRMHNCFCMKLYWLW